MSDSLNDPTSATRESGSTVSPSNFRHHLQLPTELLIAIVVALNTAYLENDSRVHDPLPPLRL